MVLQKLDNEPEQDPEVNIMESDEERQKENLVKSFKSEMKLLVFNFKGKGSENSLKKCCPCLNQTLKRNKGESNEDTFSDDAHGVNIY